MPDKKLTDNLSNNSPILSNSLSNNEIKKALEYCSKQGITSECEKCKMPKNTCRTELIGYALDLINRLQAESERLEHQLETLCLALKLVKAEAYKECIEKVKEQSNKMELVCSGALVRTDYTITEERLDNLLKELDGDNNDRP